MKKSLRLILSAMAITILSQGSLLAWSGPTQITTTGGASAPSLIQDSSGKYWVAFSYSGDVHILSSLDGIVWSTPTNITNWGNCSWSSLIQDFDGVYRLAFGAGSAEPYKIYAMSSSDGLGWSSPVQVPTIGTSFEPCIVQDLNGRYWLAYNTYSGIYITSSDDFVNWDSSTEVVSGFMAGPSLIQDSVGKYWMAYYHHGGNWEVYVTSSIDGTSWASPKEIVSGQDDVYYDTRNPELIQDSAGTYWMTYGTVDQWGNHDVALISSSDGQNWSSPTTVATGDSDDGYTSSIIQDVSGMYWVIFPSDRSGAWNLWISSNTAQEIGLFTYWKFDEGSGFIAGDSSGNGKDGIIEGATWTTGKIGDALSFDGFDDWVDVPDDISTKHITLEAWIYPTGFDDGPGDQGNAIIQRSTGGAGAPGDRSWSWRLRIMPRSHLAQFQAAGPNTGVASVVAPTALVQNRWYHLAATYDGNVMKIYVDGDLKATNSNLDGPLETYHLIPVAIGCLEGWGLQHFQGIIDEVRVYNRALTTQEIAKHATPVRISGCQMNRIPAVTSVPGATAMPLLFPEPVFDPGRFGALIRVFNSTCEIFNGALEVKQFISPSGSETGWGEGHIKIWDIGSESYQDFFIFLVPPYHEAGNWYATIALKGPGGIWARVLDTVSVEFEVKDFGQPTYTCEIEKPLWQQQGRLVASPIALSYEQLQYAGVIGTLCTTAQGIALAIPNPITSLIATAICEPFLPVVDFYNLAMDLVEDIQKNTILLSGPFVDLESGTLSFTWLTKQSTYGQCFNYDRAVITLSLPDIVEIMDSDSGLAYHHADDSKNRVLWIINGIDKQIMCLTNDYDWQHHSITTKIDDSKVTNYDINITVSLQLGPFQGVSGESYGTLSNHPMIYNYERWCTNPEDMYWYEISSHMVNATINNDRDGDGLPDSLEIEIGTDPLDDDTDNDGLLDGPGSGEDANANGIVDPGETNPRSPDTDGDGIQDGTERGLVAPEGLDTDLTIFVPDADPSSTTDPTNPDTDGDGITDGEEDINKNGEVDSGESNPNVITGVMNFDPNTLNLKSKGRWVTCYFELPEGYNMTDINLSSIRLNGTISPDFSVYEFGDYNENRITDLMVKFNRELLIEAIGPVRDRQDIVLTLTGQLSNGARFEGIETIKVISGS